MYRVIRVVAFRGTMRHPYGSQSKHGTITQFRFNVGPASNKIDRHWTSNGLRQLCLQNKVLGQFFVYKALNMLKQQGHGVRELLFLFPFLV